MNAWKQYIIVKNLCDVKGINNSNSFTHLISFHDCRVSLYMKLSLLVKLKKKNKCSCLINLFI